MNVDISLRQGYTESLFLLTYVVTTLRLWVEAPLSILNLHLCSFNVFNGCPFSSIKEINGLISKGMSNIYLKVTIEKNWCFQNFDFPGL